MWFEMYDKVGFTKHSMSFVQDGYTVTLTSVPGKADQVSLLILSPEADIVFSEPWMKPFAAVEAIMAHCVRRCG